MWNRQDGASRRRSADVSDRRRSRGRRLWFVLMPLVGLLVIGISVVGWFTNYSRIYRFLHEPNYSYLVFAGVLQSENALLCQDEDGMIGLWSLSSGRRMRSFVSKPRTGYRPIGVSSDVRQIAVPVTLDGVEDLYLHTTDSWEKFGTGKPLKLESARCPAWISGDVLAYASGDSVAFYRLYEGNPPELPRIKIENPIAKIIRAGREHAIVLSRKEKSNIVDVNLVRVGGGVLKTMSTMVEYRRPGAVVSSDGRRLLIAGGAVAELFEIEGDGMERVARLDLNGFDREMKPIVDRKKRGSIDLNCCAFGPDGVIAVAEQDVFLFKQVGDAFQPLGPVDKELRMSRLHRFLQEENTIETLWDLFERQLIMIYFDEKRCVTVNSLGTVTIWEGEGYGRVSKFHVLTTRNVWNP